MWRHMKRCHGRLHYDRKFQIFIFLIGHINVNKGVFCLMISYLQIKSYNVLNYNNCSTDWPFFWQLVLSHKDKHVLIDLHVWNVHGNNLNCQYCNYYLYFFLNGKTKYFTTKSVKLPIVLIPKDMTFIIDDSFLFVSLDICLLIPVILIIT